MREHNLKMDELPRTIQTNHVAEIENFELTEEKRKMHAMVKHVPLGADLRFVEIDMKPYVSKPTWNEFAKTLQSRAQRRNQKSIKKQKELEEERLREREIELVREFEIQQRKLNLSAESFPEWVEVVEQVEVVQQIVPPPQDKKKKQASWGIKNITKSENEKIFGSSPPPQGTVNIELQGAWAQKPSSGTTPKKKPKPTVQQQELQGSWAALPAPSTSNGTQKKKKKIVLFSSGMPTSNK